METYVMANPNDCSTSVLTAPQISRTVIVLIGPS